MSAKVLKDKFHLLYFCHFLPDLNLIIISRPKFIFITIHFQNTPNYLRKKTFFCSFIFSLFSKIEKKTVCLVYIPTLRAVFLLACTFICCFLNPVSTINHWSCINTSHEWVLAYITLK